MKRFSKFIGGVLLLALVVSVFSMKSFAYEGSRINNGVVQYGEFNSGTYGRIVFYPENFNGQERLPVLVWANGTACAPVLYTGLFEAMARQGFIVVTSSDVMSASGNDQVAGIDYIFEKNADPDSEFYNRVDTESVGAFGHSQGGRSTINAAKMDGRILACVSIAGSNTSEERNDITCPTLYLTGTMDAVVASPLWVKPTYKASNGPAVYASLKGGIHTSCILKPDSYARYIGLWFNGWLNDDTGALNAFQEGGELYNDGE